MFCVSFFCHGESHVAVNHCHRHPFVTVLSEPTTMMGLTPTVNNRPFTVTSSLLPPLLLVLLPLISSLLLINAHTATTTITTTTSKRSFFSSLSSSSPSPSKSHNCSLFVSSCTTTPTTIAAFTTTAITNGRNSNIRRGLLQKPRPKRRRPSTTTTTTTTFALQSILTAKMTNKQDIVASNEASSIKNNKDSKDSSSSSSSISPLPPRPPPSFYQRKLPESTCVGFASTKGKKIFQSALQHGGLKSFYHLIQQYHTQTEPAFCGVSTLVMVLNTLSVDPHQHWKGPWRWYEERMLNCCIDLETIKRTGITLRDFQCLALCQGLTVDLEYAYDDDDDDDHDDASSDSTNPCTSDPSSGLDRFRRAVRKTCVEEPSYKIDKDTDDDKGNHDGDDDDDDDDGGPLSVLVVSYNRRTLKQTGTGHFSPIAAYDAASDSVLILDTARFKYGAHWVKLPLIYDAMKSIDPDSGKPRGYALLSFLPSPTLEIEPGDNTELLKTNRETNRRMSLSSDGQLQPMSIMFRIKMDRNEKRRKFKRFLQSLPSRDSDHFSNYSDNNTNGSNSDHRYVLLEQIKSYLSGHRRDDDDNSNNKQHKKKEENPCIWAIVEPMRVTDDVGKSMVAQMRTLLRDLRGSTKYIDQILCGGCTREDDGGKDRQHSNNEKPSSSCCDQPQFQMNYFVSSDEALFVVYLAALSENERRDMVMNVKSEVPDLIKQQLLMEADMINSAIEMSDELASFEAPLDNEKNRRL